MTIINDYSEFHQTQYSSMLALKKISTLKK